MDGNDLLQTLQARTRKLRADLEVLAAEIHAQIAENEQQRSSNVTDEDDTEAPV